MNEYWENQDPEHYGSGINYDGKKFVVHLLGECDSILDAGCGNGLVYKAITEAGVKILKYKGVDLSKSFIEYNKKAYPEAEWEVCDINKLNEPDESYDDVLLVHCVEAMDNYEKPLTEALRVAKKRVVLVFWKGLKANWEEDQIAKLDPDGFTSMYSAKKFLRFITNLGYAHAPWLELYCDEWRYNLYFIFDKKNKRTESGHLI